MKLTPADVAALAPPPGKTDHIEWDDALPGFGVRLRGQSKVWVVQYRVGRQQRRESLGDVRKIRLDDARKIARQRFASAELGIDAVAERALAEAASLTLASVIERYLTAKRDSLRLNTLKGMKRCLYAYWKPLHQRPLAAIKRADVAARLQELIPAHGRPSAALARSYLSMVFSWAMREGLCEANPVIATNDPAAGLPTRDRILSDDEIRIVWNACADSTAASRMIRLLLLTGCRRNEIGDLQWSEVKDGVLTIPGTRTKNGRTLVLPLPAAAIELIAAMPKQDGGDFVFGRAGKGPFGGWHVAKLQLDARIAITSGKPLAPWVIHDLRRTMRSGLGQLGIPPHVAERAINHVKGGVEGIYDRYRYEREIAAALARWADHVLAIVEGRQSNVVALQSA